MFCIFLLNGEKICTCHRPTYQVLKKLLHCIYATIDLPGSCIPLSVFHTALDYHGDVLILYLQLKTFPLLSILKSVKIKFKV